MESGVSMGEVGGMGIQKKKTTAIGTAMADKEIAFDWCEGFDAGAVALTEINEQAAAKDEATASNANEEADSFEYEGLSDTSEDEDVLAEEAAIDGNA